MNNLEKEVVARHSIEVIKRIKIFFNNNEDELLTMHDFNSIQKEAWQETKRVILEQAKKESQKQ